MTALCLGAFVVSLLVSCSACGLIRVLGPRFGLVDKPGYRKIHDHVMPTGGGIGVWLGIVIPLLLVAIVGWFFRSSLITVSTDSKLFGFSLSEIVSLMIRHLPGFFYQGQRLLELLGLGTILLVLGTLDDRYGLSWKIRILIQLAVAIVAVSRGWKATFFVDIPWLTSTMSVLWIVALINSFNMLDNMDGLSAGVALLCAGFLAAVMFLFACNPVSGEPQIFIGAFLVLLCGALTGFLIHNRPPARLFMGDGGAYFVGFLLATLTLTATFVGPNSSRQGIFVPLCIFAVPLYDLCSVVLIRLKHGTSPFQGDKNHYSHRLVELGLSRTGAVLTIYLTTAVCCVSSLFLYQVNQLSACLVLGQVLMILGLIGILEYASRQQRKKKS